MNEPVAIPIEIEQLPESLKEIAQVIGVENAIKLSREFKGVHLYIPGIGRLERKTRNGQIRSDYDQGNVTVKQLARRHSLSQRQVEKILSMADDT